ncbi:MAG: glutaredoxin family protein [Colwellia sp.]
MKKYNLYSSDGCHLCEEAITLLESVMSLDNLVVIDIVDQTHVSHETLSLVELYGVHIPVLESLSTHEKLFWPFSAQQIKELK